MIWFIGLLRTKFGQYAAIALGALATIFAFRAKWRGEGRADAERKAKDADVQRADDIRRRARDADGNGVSIDEDKRGWRD